MSFIFTCRQFEVAYVAFLLGFDALYLCQLNYLSLSIHFYKMNIKCVWYGIAILLY